MNAVIGTIKDRRLELAVPADWPDGMEVEVFPRTVSAFQTDRESWLGFLEKTGGSIADPTFERPPQGEVEERESLP